MKNLSLKRVLINFMFCAMFSLFLTPAFGAAAFAASFIPMPGGMFAGLYTEVWTGELIKKLRAGENATWLEGIPDYSQYADKEVIHMVNVGADPDVLINNTTYPIPTQQITDLDVTVKLDKYQTKATPVTDDELHALSYDKKASVVERHKDAIMLTKFARSIFNLAPQADDTKTPVVKTSGANTEDGRLAITRKDIIALKKRFDKMGVPTKGRRLVLCHDHINDLLEIDQKFADQYYNYLTGKIANLYSFEVYEETDCPMYDGSTFAKKAFGTVPSAGTDFQGSVAFYVPRMFKAIGLTKAYFDEPDTAMQESRMNYRHYFIAQPKTPEAIGAIASKKV